MTNWELVTYGGNETHFVMDQCMSLNNSRMNNFMGVCLGLFLEYIHLILLFFADNLYSSETFVHRISRDWINTKLKIENTVNQIKFGVLFWCAYNWCTIQCKFKLNNLCKTL